MTTPSRTQQESASVAVRLAAVVALTLSAAALGGWLGLLLMPHLGKIVLAVLAGLLIWVMVVSVVDFFRG